MSGELPSTLRLCVGLCYCMNIQPTEGRAREALGEAHGGTWLPRVGSYLQSLQRVLHGRSMAYWQAHRIPFPHFCPLFSYVEDWQAFPGKSQTVNIRLCKPFGLCLNSPALPLPQESSQRYKQMAEGCVPTKLNLSTLQCAFHDTLLL